MGIGLSASGVNMNRLPGWDKHSYGYHGDDGHSFCSSGTGQPYGPTFTTGDVIGCGINLLDNTCFYTKNGHHLGIAFTDLPVRKRCESLKVFWRVRMRTNGITLYNLFVQFYFRQTCILQLDYKPREKLLMLILVNSLSSLILRT